MRISIVCSDGRHPIYPRLADWAAGQAASHELELVGRKAELSGGDLLFLISCHEIIGADVRGRYKAVLVIHASDLPQGRGWSPHIWQILRGDSRIKVTLLEAEDAVDAGAIWAQEELVFEGHELCDEINDALFDAEIRLMDLAVASFGQIRPQQQDARTPSYFPKRKPEDSALDPYKTIAEQFDMMRVADPKRFPSYFDYRNHRYYVTVSKEHPNAGN